MCVNDFVISADEKTSIQADAGNNRLCRPLRTALPGLIRQLGHPSLRFSTAARSKTGFVTAEPLVTKIKKQEPYKSARCAFWITDNCSAHRGQRAANASAPNGLTRSSSTLRSTPVGSTKSNIYFSIVQRKVFTPNDFSFLAGLVAPGHHEPSPFEWTFTTKRPADVLARDRAFLGLRYHESAAKAMSSLGQEHRPLQRVPFLPQSIASRQLFCSSGSMGSPPDR